MKQNEKVTVYFDGSCPICTREIDVYRRRSGEQVDYIDVSTAENMVAPDLAKHDAMARFHVRGANGELLDGGAAFTALWRATPGFAFLGRMFALPGLRQFANIGYDLFLKVRPAVQSFAKRIGLT